MHRTINAVLVLNNISPKYFSGFYHYLVTNVFDGLFYDADKFYDTSSPFVAQHFHFHLNGNICIKLGRISNSNQNNSEFDQKVEFEI